MPGTPREQAEFGVRFVRSAGIARSVSRTALALREWWVARRLHWHAVGIAAAAAALAVLGPFGTWDLFPTPVRLAYWGSAIAANWLLALTVVPSVVAACLRHRVSEWVGLSTGCVVAALPGAGAVAFLNALAGIPAESGAELGLLFLQVLFLHAVFGSLAYLLIHRPLAGRPNRATSGDPEEAPPPPPSGPLPAGGDELRTLLDALPEALGRELVRLRMKDHYVEVHTPLGHALVLMRFRDALRCVAQIDGLQVHRSHWVARNAVATVTQTGGRTELRLRDGERVPVSRSFLSALRAAGWIADVERRSGGD